MNDEQNNQQSKNSWEKTLDRLKRGRDGDDVSENDSDAEVDTGWHEDSEPEDQIDDSDIDGIDNQISYSKFGSDEPEISDKSSLSEVVNRLQSDLMAKQRNLDLQLIHVAESARREDKLKAALESALEKTENLKKKIEESQDLSEALKAKLTDIERKYSEGWLQHTEISDVTKATRREEWDSYISWLGSHIAAQTDGKLVSANPLAVRVLDLNVLMRAVSKTDPDGLIIVPTDGGKPLVLNPIDTTTKHLELTTHLALAVASALSASEVVEPGSPAPEMDDALELLVRQLQSLEAERSGFECGLATYLANALLSTLSCLAVSRYRDGDSFLDASEVIRGAMSAAVAWLEAILPTYSPSTAPNRRKIEQEEAESLPRTRARAWLLGGDARAIDPANIDNASELLGLIAGGKVNSGFDRSTVMSAASTIQKTLDEYAVSSSDRAVGAAIIVELICDHWSE